MCSRILVKNLNPDTSCDTLSLFLERYVGEIDDTQIEYSADKTIALVALDQDIEDIENLIKDAKPLEGNVLSITEAPPIDSILITNIPKGVTEDHVKLYFAQEKVGGGETQESLTLCNLDCGYAVLTFNDSKVVDTVTARKHVLLNVTVNVVAHNRCLGLPVYLKTSGGGELNNVDGNIEPPSSVLPMKSSPQSVYGSANTTRALAGDPDPVGFETYLEPELHALGLDDGYVFLKPLSYRNPAAAEPPAQTQNGQQVSPTDHSRQANLERKIVTCGTKAKALLLKRENLQHVTIKDINVEIRGTRVQVMKSQIEVYEMMDEMVEKTEKLSQRLQNVFKKAAVRDLINREVSKKGLKVEWTLGPVGITVTAFGSDVADETIKMIEALTDSEKYVVQKESQPLLEMKTLKDMVQKFNQTRNAVIECDTTEVVIEGLKEDVTMGFILIKKYFQENTIVSSTIPVDKKGKLSYLKTHCEARIKGAVRQPKTKMGISFNFKDNHLTVSGVREDVEQFKDEVNKLLKEIDHVTFQETTPVNISNVPSEIQNFGPELLEVYRKALSEGKTKVYRIRLILLGHHAAGKTRLRKALLKQHYDPEKDFETNGVEIDADISTVSISKCLSWNVNDKKGNTSLLIADVIKKISLQSDRSSEKDQHLDSNLTKQATGSASGTDLSTHTIVAGIDKKTDEKVSDQSMSPESDPSFNMDQAGMDQARETHDALMRSSEGQDGMESDECKIQLSIWDFGGHHVYYNTHQTFLSQRAIYLMVLNAENDLEKEVHVSTNKRSSKRPVLDKTVPQKVKDHCDYWMDSVHGFTTGEKVDEKDCPPVLIVGTHRDMLQESKIEEFCSNVQDHFKGKLSHNKHIYNKKYFVVNATDDNDPELNALKEIILDIASKQPYWEEERPCKWLLLESQLHKQSKQRYLNLDEVLQIARMEPINMTDQKEVKACLVFLHAFGEVIYFDEEVLEDIVILEPQWLVDAFCSFITLPKYEERSRDTLALWDKLHDKAILDEELVDKKCEEMGSALHGKKEEILHLMKKFDIISECPECSDRGFAQYFVPCLAKFDHEPNRDIPQDSLRYESKEKFFPNCLFYRLSTACLRSYDIHNDGLHAKCVHFTCESDPTGRCVFSVWKELHSIRLEVVIDDVKPPNFKHLCISVRRFIEEQLEEIARLYCPNFHTICQIYHADCKKWVELSQRKLKNLWESPRLRCSGCNGVFSVEHSLLWFEEPKKEEAGSGTVLEYMPALKMKRYCSKSYFGREESLPMESEEEFVDEVIVKPCLDNFYNTFSNDLKEVYKNTSTPRGRSLIINNRTFNCDTPKLANRHGTELDVDKMEELLNQLGYRVSVHHDLTAKGMFDLLKKESERTDHQKYDSFILVLLSHGLRGAVYGTDGFVISYEQIIECFNNASCPALRSKPKMIFIQACQGNSRDHGAGRVPLPEPAKMLPSNQNTTHDAPGDEGEIVPTMADFLVAKATTPDFVSWRNREIGTWFIQSIVTVFCRYAWKDDVLSMFSKVNALVAKSKTSRGMKQVSQTESTLLKKIYFFPGK